MRGYELIYPCTDKGLKQEYELYLKKSHEHWEDYFVGKNKPIRLKQQFEPAQISAKPKKQPPAELRINKPSQQPQVNRSQD